VYRQLLLRVSSCVTSNRRGTTTNGEENVKTRALAHFLLCTVSLSPSIYVYCFSFLRRFSSFCFVLSETTECCSPLRDPAQTTTTSRLRPPSRSKSPDAESCLRFAPAPQKTSPPLFLSYNLHKNLGLQQLLHPPKRAADARQQQRVEESSSQI
jgi:hypothetical protein